MAFLQEEKKKGAILNRLQRGLLSSDEWDPEFTFYAVDRRGMCVMKKSAIMTMRSLPSLLDSVLCMLAWVLGRCCA